MFYYAECAKKRVPLTGRADALRESPLLLVAKPEIVAKSDKYIGRLLSKKRKKLSII